MKILEELLPGCFLLEPTRINDLRGRFVKTYHEDFFKTLGINLVIREEFYSISKKNVVRGMHFQMPPNDQEKLVYCTSGEVVDVLLDLRQGNSYGSVASTNLSIFNSRIIYIPKGIAHGFKALEDETVMIYKTSTVHAPESDVGIGWDSFGFDWSVNDPIISGRDQAHLDFNKFISNF